MVLRSGRHRARLAPLAQSGCCSLPINTRRYPTRRSRALLRFVAVPGGGAITENCCHTTRRSRSRYARRHPEIGPADAARQDAVSRNRDHVVAESRPGNQIGMAIDRIPLGERIYLLCVLPLLRVLRNRAGCRRVLLLA